MDVVRCMWRSGKTGMHIMGAAWRRQGCTCSDARESAALCRSAGGTAAWGSSCRAGRRPDSSPAPGSVGTAAASAEGGPGVAVPPAESGAAGASRASPSTDPAPTCAPRGCRTGHPIFDWRRTLDAHARALPGVMKGRNASKGFLTTAVHCQRGRWVRDSLTSWQQNMHHAGVKSMKKAS